MTDDRAMDHRLERTVVPEHYAIEISPDLDAASFAGTVAIDVDVVEPTDTLVVNAIELVIHEATVTAGGAAMHGEPTLDEDRERLIVTLPEQLPPGPATLTVRFTGTLDDRLRGFYRSTYTDAEGTRKVIASTQFEATDARRAFPCWDEPDFKATFSVSLVVDDHLSAVSNGAEVSRTPIGDGRARVEFARTVPMSTYLVAFVVGELEATEPVDVDGVALRIVTTPGKLHLTHFALDVGAFALRYFADYYDVPYPGDKLDMVAIPDFSWGAMENLGCITYREASLLIDDATATQGERIGVATTIAHEIAHMWFGDLVTMKWWNGVWLNEAFATFAETKCTDAFRPDWKLWLGFCADRASSQETDALATTRPIEYPVSSPEEADAMFDVLTYEKGSSVLRMMEQYLGEDVFRAGVSLYLKRHGFSNTDNEDLWAALEEASGQPVADIMDTWILQGGFPQIAVEAADGGATLTQRQFRYLGEGDAAWQIPVRYRSSLGIGRTLVGRDPVTVPAGDGLVVNAGGDGFYRVAYDEDLLADLTRRLGALDPTERYGVVSDTFASVLAGSAPAADYLALVRTMDAEDEPDVWKVMLAGLGELDRIVSSDDRDAFAGFVGDLVSGPLDRLGWSPADGEADRTRALRGTLLRALGNLGRDRATIEAARGVAADPERADPEVADAALMVTAMNGDLDDFERFLDRSATAPTPQLAVKNLRAAAAVPHPDVAPAMVERVIDRRVRTQDSYWVLAALIGHRENGPAAWRIVTERWDEVLAALPPTNAYRILDGLYLRSEPDVASSIETWFATHGIPGAELKTRQRLEQLRVRVALRARESGRLGASLP